MADSRMRALVLYRNILKTHITKLPLDLCHLGSSYVRNEFKLHKNVEDSKVLAQFYSAWEDYLEQLKQQADRGRRFGSDLSDKEHKVMSEAQREKLEQLKVEVREDILSTKSLG
ncbi:LYR motif-containing protein [archaeon]|nr:MAG: LYR motif-containing protein [archaeon]